jgi:hypothetical protein
MTPLVYCPLDGTPSQVTTTLERNELLIRAFSQRCEPFLKYVFALLNLVWVLTTTLTSQWNPSKVQY